MTALVGIDPKTKRCEIVGSNTTDTAEEIRKNGYIQVTIAKPKAREIWGEIVPDVYALVAPNGGELCVTPDPLREGTK